ncbi:hypothetical protein K435DRAFT_646762, partial [Dendrothele bispora CBS 962.96]
VHGSLARAGKVKSQTPKVEAQEKKKTPKGRAKNRRLKCYQMCCQTHHHHPKCRPKCCQRLHRKQRKHALKRKTWVACG